MTIGDHAFDDSNLGELSLPYGLTKIGAGAFNANSRLETLVIPASVTEIGSEAFNNNPHIKLVKVDRTSPPILGDDGFNQYTYFSALLQVPDDAVMAYKRAAEWSNFQYINEVPSGVSEFSSENEYQDDKDEVMYDLQGRKTLRGRGIRIDPRTRRVVIIR